MTMNRDAQRLAVLKQHLPGLWGPGTLLYIGASDKRFQCGPELAEAGRELTLLEVWPSNLEHYQNHEAVAHAVLGDVRTVAIEGLPHPHYDVAFWWHGPEHVTAEELSPTLARLESLADLVVLGCPWGECPQEGDDNPYQAHRAALYPEDLRKLGYRVATVTQLDRLDSLIAWKWPARPQPRVIGVVIVFNEEGMLPGCLDSLMGQVDHIVVVDGAYARFPHQVPWSTDATREIAWCYGAEWIPCPNGQPWPTQVEKRTAYLVGQEGDWYLHLDADERLRGVLPWPEDGLHYAFRINNRTGSEVWAPRLFQHRGHMRYQGSHNALWSDDRLINLPGAVQVPAEQCRLIHLAFLREMERQLDKRRYYAWQKPAERPYRRAHGI
jgi:hypothetical protein